ncbi:MAG: Stp1/IreP family PP2C-type Ser/Thr phosphatase [Anaerolineae bacterium]|nr:Stp1/IreP family PP2C-type Ser/Thr phosphatase [Anaerolineae bacterium]
MKLDRNNGQTRGVQSLPASISTNSGVLSLLLTVLLFQSNQLITFIILGVAVGIILIFILIAFILLPLSRRTRQRRQKPRQADLQPPQEIASEVTETQETPDTAVAEADDDDDATKIIAPIPEIGEVEEDTILSIPALQPVVEPTAAEPTTTPVSGQRPANIGWQIAGITDVGLRRELNEDDMVMIEDEMVDLGPYGIYVVADGLGGHEAGEVASRLTVDAIREQYANQPPTASQTPFEEWLKGAVMTANQAVLEHQESNTETSRMGSTLVMALVAGANAHIVNVGDSRAYRLNSDKIEQISVDHSLVERLVQIGQISREEARTHKQRNVIYSIIGEKRKLEIGFYHVTLAPGERLLLCSDGLSGMISDEELQRISYDEPEPANASRLMIEAARKAGGHDNITAIIVQINGEQ